MFKFILKKFLLLVLILTISSTFSILCLPVGLVYGQFSNPLTDARTEGIGGAATAVYSIGTVLESNPSLLATGKDFGFSTTIFPRFSPVDNLNLLSTMNVVTVNLQQLGAAGVSYNGLFSGSTNRSYYTETQINVAYAYNVLDLINVGATLHVRSFSVPIDLAQIQKNSYYNVTIGASTAALVENLVVGITGKNIFEFKNKAYPLDIFVAPSDFFGTFSFDNSLINPLLARKVAAGAQYIFEQDEDSGIKTFTSSDISFNIDNQQWDLSIGGQSTLLAFAQADDLLFGNYIALRGGLIIKNFLGAFNNFAFPNSLLNTFTPSVGLGINSQIAAVSFAIDYTFSYPLVFIGSLGNHIVSLTVKF